MSANEEPLNYRRDLGDGAIRSAEALERIAATLETISHTLELMEERQQRHEKRDLAIARVVHAEQHLNRTPG